MKTKKDYIDRAVERALVKTLGLDLTDMSGADAQRYRDIATAASKAAFDDGYNMLHHSLLNGTHEISTSSHPNGPFVHTLLVKKGYEGLLRVLQQALDQAQSGKGAERHNLGGDLPFDRQRMQSISELIGSPDGMVYQVCKKVTEGVALPTFERQERELLGAINYIAGIIIFLRGRELHADDGRV